MIRAKEDICQFNHFKSMFRRPVLQDLKERLADTRWPDEVEGTGWDYGTNLGYMKELADYWQHQYDWRKQEAELNKFAHFKAEIDGTGNPVHPRARQRSEPNAPYPLPWLAGLDLPLPQADPHADRSGQLWR